MHNPGLAKAIKSVGGMRKLARALGITHGAIQQWARTRVPAERVLDIERLTGVPREELRPDLYPPGTVRRPPKNAAATRDLSPWVNQAAS
jgi:DNA-binding transcriptional regulator YdaS (Cro superfamily)